MVFVELKSSYLAELRNTSGMVNIIDYIFLQKAPFSNHADPNSTEFAVNSLIKAVFSKDADTFSEIEETYKRKNPDSKSPWINNNYLIFLFAIGLEIFNKDKIWLKNVISVRKCQNDESVLIMDFFISILSTSFDHKGKLSPLLLSYKYLTDPSNITKEQLKVTILELVSVSTFPCFENEYLNILYLHAFEVSLVLKDMEEVDLKSKVNAFEVKIEQRISLLANVLLYFIISCQIGIVFLFMKYIFLSLSEGWKNSIITILGITGITILEVFKARKFAKTKIASRIQKFLGYDLLKRK